MLSTQKEKFSLHYLSLIAGSIVFLHVACTILTAGLFSPRNRHTLLNVGFKLRGNSRHSTSCGFWHFCEVADWVGVGLVTCLSCPGATQYVLMLGDRKGELPSNVAFKTWGLLCRVMATSQWRFYLHKMTLRSWMKKFSLGFVIIFIIVFLFNLTSIYQV